MTPHSFDHRTGPPEPLTVFATFLNVDDIRLDNTRPDPQTGVNRLDPLANAVSHPDWPAIEAALRSLDGSNVRLVFLGERPPEPDTGWPFHGAGLAIGGGGANGLYVCTFSETYDVESCMTRPDDDRDDEAVVMFGCETVTPLQHCFGFDDILAVARSFAVQGRLPAGYNWVPPLPSRFLDR